MALVKNNLVVKDSWTFVADDADLPEGDIIVTLARWQDQREELLARGDNLGLILQSDENPSAIFADLTFFQVIALNFPVFGDGRAYSYARLLRERHKFEGEIRAIGDVSHDQLFLMNRCGFDAYEIEADDQKALQTWLDAQAEMTTFYQPTGDGRRTVSSLRERRRLAKAAS
ncbi:Oxidoreductase probably involved in sulfite reduction [Candidatus Terasakiella magnetica]|uniref:Oxidoreductase probably involved in sulfite reduction n=1 Tax=Candidatus Terasakiella magnetica TaxID=1867952 RepID=A0A1C3RK99_9PROT|nr:DUF934 domain-containing protein [Candidatus Terasakiella magnetica]SCA57641.1 Oxidoreductase probably involved in sulfite reduction [Candidatus Terasakiella magnetica]